MNLQKLLYQNITWRGLYYFVLFILNIAIARHFKAELTGWLYYLVSIYAFITLIASVSMEAGIIYFASSKKIDPSTLLNFSVLWVVGVALLVTILFYISKNLFNISVSNEEYLFALVFICGNLLISFLTNLFYANKKFIISNRIGIIINLLLIGAIFFINEKLWFNNEKYIFTYFASYLLQGIILIIVFLRSEGRIKFLLPSSQQLKELFRYCMLAFISNVIMFFVYRVDYWFVHYYRSAEELGNYIQVSKIAQMFFVLPGILAGVVFPVTAGGAANEIHEKLALLSRSLLLVYSIICIFLIVTGYWLFPFVFGASFHSMYVPFVFIIPGILALSALYPLTAYYAGKNKVIVNVTGTVLALIVIIIGDWIFIPVYGINAAALVSSIAYITCQLYVLLYFKNENKNSVTDFYTLRFSDLLKMKRSLFNYLNTSVLR